MDDDVIAWRYEPTGQQTWAKDDQTIHIEVDEYGIVEIAGDLLKSLLIAAAWVRIERERSGPAP